MENLILIALYIVSLILCALVNRALYRSDDCYPIVWLLWIIPIINSLTTIALFLLLLGESAYKFNVTKYFERKWKK